MAIRNDLLIYLPTPDGPTYGSESLSDDLPASAAQRGIAQIPDLPDIVG